MTNLPHRSSFLRTLFVHVIIFIFIIYHTSYLSINHIISLFKEPLCNNIVSSEI
jgi:hypothetical protein